MYFPTLQKYYTACLHTVAEVETHARVLVNGGSLRGATPRRVDDSIGLHALSHLRGRV